MREGDLVIRVGRYGKFIACTRYPDCKYTEAISEGDEIALSEMSVSDSSPQDSSRQSAVLL